MRKSVLALVTAVDVTDELCISGTHKVTFRYQKGDLFLRGQFSSGICLMYFQKCMKHEQPEIRTIHVGHNVCSSITGEEVYIPHKYPHNQVVSSQV